MHELSIAMSIVDLVQEEASSRGGFQVEAVHLKLGQLSGVVKEALLFSFELACEQTPLQGSKLVIEEVPVLVNCPTCQAQRAVRSLQCLCCAECGTPAHDVVAGREIFVTALEIRQTGIKACVRRLRNDDPRTPDGGSKEKRSQT